MFKGFEALMKRMETLLQAWGDFVIQSIEGHQKAVGKLNKPMEEIAGLAQDIGKLSEEIGEFVKGLASKYEKKEEADKS